MSQTIYYSTRTIGFSARTLKFVTHFFSSTIYRTVTAIFHKLSQQTHLREKVHANQHLNKVVRDQSVFELERFAIFHKSRPP